MIDEEKPDKSESEQNTDEDPDNLVNIEVNDDDVEIVETIVTEEEISKGKYDDMDLDDEETLKVMLQDFTSMDDFDVEDLMEVKSAMEEVKENLISDGETSSNADKISPIKDVIAGYPGWGIYPLEEKEFQPEDVSEDLEAKIQRELAKKREQKQVTTEKMFKEYCSQRRNKIWYHALWFLIFNVEDHQANKVTLYDALKDVTSKNAIDPTPEHKFYFGLGFILRLNVNDKKVIEFLGDKLKINNAVGVDFLTDILREVGPPISERPVITDNEKKQMFLDFMSDDFMDI